MILTRLKEFLDASLVEYVVISHSVAYTAQGIAALTHIPGRELAKTVMVKLNDHLAMAVVPASYHVDLVMLRKAAKAQSVSLASEAEFKDRFPDCELGAMPPFGNLYDLAVFADDALTHDQEVAFNAGSHRELVKMAWADYARLVNPRIAQLTTRRAMTAA